MYICMYIYIYSQKRVMSSFTASAEDSTKLLHELTVTTGPLTIGCQSSIGGVDWIHGHLDISR